MAERVFLVFWPRSRRQRPWRRFDHRWRRGKRWELDEEFPACGSLALAEKFARAASPEDVYSVVRLTGGHNTEVAEIHTARGVTGAPLWEIVGLNLRAASEVSR